MLFKLRQPPESILQNKPPTPEELREAELQKKVARLREVMDAPGGSVEAERILKELEHWDDKPDDPQGAA